MLFSIYSNAQCLEDTHSSFKSQSWLSCNTKANPVESRGESHWLSLDLVYEYQIDSLWIWNHNVWGETGNGIKEIIIDYSSDAINWNTIGPFTLDKAPGSWKYNSPSLLNLGNISARYIVLTVIQTWDPLATCAGIAEMKINVNFSTSTVNIPELTELVLSPNPTSSKISIEAKQNLGRCNVLIYNSLGQLVKELQEESFKRLDLDIMDFEDGIYFINVQSQDFIITKSFVKTSR